MFACGGDGTVHEVLQGLVSESGARTAALGVIPLGSANALARHLGLSLDPLKAALQQVDASPREIPVGKVECGGQARYFTVMAGAGPDGALVYSLATAQKSNFGRLAYYLRAARLYATRRFDPFAVEFADAASSYFAGPVLVRHRPRLLTRPETVKQLYYCADRRPCAGSPGRPAGAGYASGTAPPASA